MSVGVAGGEPVTEAFPAAFGQVGPRPQEQSADPVERITGAAAMPEGVLLHPAAGVGHGGGGQADGVEVIDHQRGVGQDVADGDGVATERVDRRDADLVDPLGWLLATQSRTT